MGVDLTIGVAFGKKPEVANRLLEVLDRNGLILVTVGKLGMISQIFGRCPRPIRSKFGQIRAFSSSEDAKALTFFVWHAPYVRFYISPRSVTSDLERRVSSANDLETGISALVAIEPLDDDLNFYEIGNGNILSKLAEQDPILFTPGPERS